MCAYDLNFTKVKQEKKEQCSYGTLLSHKLYVVFQRKIKSIMKNRLNAAAFVVEYNEFIVIC